MARSLSREASLLSFGASQRTSDGAPHRVTTGAGDENRTRVLSLGTSFPLFLAGFSELWRTG
jgi:hypothetical protein